MSIDIAALVASNMAKFGGPIGVKPCTLIKSIPGTRMPGAISAGTNPTTQTFAASGFVSDYTAYELQSTLIAVGDRKVVLFGASIAGGVEPEPADRISIGNERLTIVTGGVSSDPVKATFTCQTRK